MFVVPKHTCEIKIGYFNLNQCSYETAEYGTQILPSWLESVSLMIESIPAKRKGLKKYNRERAWWTICGSRTRFAQMRMIRMLILYAILLKSDTRKIWQKTVLARSNFRLFCLWWWKWLEHRENFVPLSLQTEVSSSCSFFLSP